MNLPATAFPGAAVRAKELEYVMDCIRHGDCCSVIGPSNTGKSFLLRSLPTEEIRQRCAQDGAKPPVMVFVDCLEAGSSERAFYELLLRRTIEELEVVGVSASTVETLRQLHSEVLHHSIVDVAIRSIYATSVRQIGQEENLTVVLIFDEFYDVFRHLPPWPFRQLRALYNALEGKICYIVATSHHLEQLRSGTDTYEFRELFHMHTLLLQPMIKADAQRFVIYLAQKQGLTISEENISLLVKLSGGHPGILERIYLMLNKEKVDLTSPLNLTASELIRKRPIYKECRRLWSELETEHKALLTLIEKGEQALEANQKQLLEAKGLIIPTKESGLTVFSLLFAEYVQQELIGQSDAVVKGLRCDFETGQIWVDDQEMTLQLSEPQRKIITFLYQKAGIICTYDEIAHGVWGVGEGVSPGAIYELVKRVRQKIEPDWKQPYYIVTVPGKGYRLENSG